MTNRREFLQLGLLACAGGGLPYSGIAGVEPAADLDAPLRLNLLQDRRYPAAAAYVRDLERDLQGHLARAAHIVPGRLAITGIDRELTQHWFGAWQQSEGLSLAGTTGADVLFCLEQLGRSRGLRVLWRSSHGSHDDGSGAQALYSWILAGSTASIV